MTLILSFGVFAQPSGVRSSDDGTVVGTISEQEVAAKGIGYLLGLKSPEIVLVSKSGERFDLKSSKKLRKLVEANWKKTIRYFYNSYLVSGSDDRKFSDNAFKKSKTYSEIKKQFKKVKVKFFGKKRKISEDESVKILEVLCDAALGLVEKAKEVKGEYTKLKILTRSYPTSKNCRRRSGKTILRVIFHKSSRITGVELLKTSYCRGFDESAEIAAWKLMFEPAMQDGKPITTVKRMQYSFTIH